MSGNNFGNFFILKDMVNNIWYIILKYYVVKSRDY